MLVISSVGSIPIPIPISVAVAVSVSMVITFSPGLPADLALAIDFAVL